jgi:hypothetical protein
MSIPSAEDAPARRASHDRADRRAPAGRRPRHGLAAGLRRSVLTAHIVLSVGLLGEVAAFLTIAVRSAAADDAAFAATGYDLLASFQILFGIPFSLGALATGVTLGLGTKWGILRHAWVTIKLVLLLSVVLVGALLLGPSVDAARGGDDSVETRIIAGGVWDVAALLTATGLSVFKPGRARRSR